MFYLRLIFPGIAMPRAKTHVVLLQLYELNVSLLKQNWGLMYFTIKVRERLLLSLLILFEFFRMARICWFSDSVRAGLQKTCSVRHTNTEYPGGKCQLCPSATVTRGRSTSFRARPATGSRVPAMDARCGLSTRGHWDGPVICNEMGRVSVCPSCSMANVFKVIAIITINRYNNS
jgi:hypothetical protein